MPKIRFIGDIHGKQLSYLNLIDGIERSVQVGDFGVGFGTAGDPSFIDFQLNQMPGDHKFIRGNHDHPQKCKLSSHWIKDGYIDHSGIMYIGGAWSIDHGARTPGLDWWEDEELSIVELDKMIGWYTTVRPKVVVSHTAPLNIPAGPMGFRIWNGGSRTETALQAMLDRHRPEYWIFGHWHKSFDRTLDGTRFICLNELEYIDLEI